MTRMVSGLKLNATIRVSKIPNSFPPDSGDPPGLDCEARTFFV